MSGLGVGMGDFTESDRHTPLSHSTSDTSYQNTVGGETISIDRNSSPGSNHHTFDLFETQGAHGRETGEETSLSCTNGQSPKQQQQQQQLLAPPAKVPCVMNEQQEHPTVNGSICYNQIKTEVSESTNGAVVSSDLYQYYGTTGPMTRRKYSQQQGELLMKSSEAASRPVDNHHMSSMHMQQQIQDGQQQHQRCTPPGTMDMDNHGNCSPGSANALMMINASSVMGSGHKFDDSIYSTDQNSNMHQHMASSVSSAANVNSQQQQMMGNWGEVAHPCSSNTTVSPMPVVRQSSHHQHAVVSHGEDGKPIDSPEMSAQMAFFAMNPDDNVEGSFNCQLCGRHYTHIKKLKRHVFNSHKKEKKYVCDICGKRFGYKHILQEHQNLHFGLKPYVCSLCNKRFAAKSNLIQHRHRHMANQNNMNSRSTLNSNTVAARQQRNQIQQRHHHHHQQQQPQQDDNKHQMQHQLFAGDIQANLQCSQCNERFPTEESLRAHESTVHEAVNFRCVICNHNCETSTAYRDHCTTSHPDMKIDSPMNNVGSVGRNGPPVLQGISPHDARHRQAPVATGNMMAVHHSTGANCTGGYNPFVPTVQAHQTSLDFHHRSPRGSSNPHYQEMMSRSSTVVTGSDCPNGNGAGSSSSNHVQMYNTLMSAVNNGTNNGSPTNHFVGRPFDSSPDHHRMLQSSDVFGNMASLGQLTHQTDRKPDRLTLERHVDSGYASANGGDMSASSSGLTPARMRGSLPLSHQLQAAGDAAFGGSGGSGVKYEQNSVCSGGETVLQMSREDTAVQVDCCSVPSTSADAMPMEELLNRFVAQGRLFRCRHCDVYFTERGMYCLHTVLHGVDHPWQCSVCGKRMADKNEFTLHFVNQQNHTA